MNLFCGYDERESDGFHVFCHSVISRASQPVAIVPLSAMGLPQGSNTFTLSRFLIPYLMGFKGHAIFADASDMLMLGDVEELDAMFDPAYAVQLVKHPNYQTSHKIKYVGTDMECPNLDYSRKNWASLMIINCEHRVWSHFDPELIESAHPLSLLQFAAFDDSMIGDLPDSWNRLVDEGQDPDGAKLLHWTAGVPAFPAYANAPGADAWHAERHHAFGGIHGR